MSILLAGAGHASGPSRVNVPNGDYENMPTYVASTNVNGRFVDGTAAGSTSNATYIWNLNAGGTFAARFDNTVSHSGSGSFKASTLAGASYCVAGHGFSNTRRAALGITVLPSRQYKVTVWQKTNYVSGASSQGSRFVVDTWEATGTTLKSSVQSSYVTTTVDWTMRTILITTAADATLMTFQFGAEGSGGTGTLVMDAWFDDFELTLL